MIKTHAGGIALIAGAVVLLIALGLVYAATRPGDDSTTCSEFFAGMENPPAAALAWCNAGSYFSWESTLAVNDRFEPVNIFNVCQGDPATPAILLIHGYPTSSFDFAPLMANLSTDYYVCALDTPGYGFSDKPGQGFDYSIFDDAQLVDEYVREVVAFEEFTLLTHDKGDSVGLALLQLYQGYDERPATINHRLITNGNVYLPLAQLTTFQTALLNTTTGPLLTRFVRGGQLASGLAEQAFASDVPPDEVASYAATFDYQDGGRWQHDIILYLAERAENEVVWLDALAASDIPTTLIWGEQDAIAPVTVPDFVWETALEKREAPASYWQIPCADHYLQVDTPDLIEDIVRATLANESLPYSFEGQRCSASLVDTNE
ncbi:MAG: alpha/beta hydrolase [Chloroflexi bacterium]|nr:alpha/beta hydrolase [Chloroflexota bacterium]